LRKVLADFNQKKRDESPMYKSATILQRDISANLPNIGNNPHSLSISKLNPNSSQQSMIGAQSRASLMVDDGLVVAAENNVLRQHNSEL
jgi:hypothetical protein